jgi:hypothetical protein
MSFLRYGAIATVAVALAFGQDPQKQPGQAEKGRAAEKGGAITGCLTKGDSAGQYNLATAGGQKVTVTGPADLDKHAQNHTVKLTGSMKGGTFEATAIEHVSATCDAGAAKP